MTKEELIKKLKELGVLNRYSLDGYIAPNMTVLYPQATSWDLFFVDEIRRIWSPYIISYARRRI